MSDLYLVTWEDSDGTWSDDPEGFDTEAEARECAARALSRLRRATTVAIYSCSLISLTDGEWKPPVD